MSPPEPVVNLAIVLLSYRPHRLYDVLERLLEQRRISPGHLPSEVYDPFVRRPARGSAVELVPRRSRVSLSSPAASRIG